MERSTLVLGVVAVAAVATAIAVAIFNGHHGSTKRSAVATYIDAVDQVQQNMRVPLARVLAAYHDFTRPGSNAITSAKQLGAAASTLSTVRRRIAALTPPPQAGRLHRLMLELVDAETAVTNEVQQLAAFTPRYRTAVAAYQQAGTSLSRGLAAVHLPKAHRLRGTKQQILAAQRMFAVESDAAAGGQAAVVDAYDAVLAVVLRAFHRLHPPAALAPAYAAQVHALGVTRVAGARLSAALRSTNRSHVPVLGRAFTSASRIAQSVAAQKAEIAAIKGYNRRARAITAAAGRVRVEVAHLQGALS